MPQSPPPLPADAEPIIFALQRRVIRGVTLISAVGTPILVVIWEMSRSRSGGHSPVLLALEIALTGGVIG